MQREKTVLKSVHQFTIIASKLFEQLRNRSVLKLDICIAVIVLGRTKEPRQRDKTSREIFYSVISTKWWRIIEEKSKFMGNLKKCEEYICRNKSANGVKKATYPIVGHL